MARFVVKVGKEETVIQGDRVVIGARSSCNLILSDPLAAQEHCQVVASQGGYQVVDGGTTLGTFVDGLAAVDPRPLVDGSQIIIGVSRIKVSITQDDETGESLVLTPDKKYFYYDDKKDALDWSRKEVAFGRFAPLRNGNWIAVFALLALLPFWFIPATSDRLIEPGPTWHSTVAAYHDQLGGLEVSDQDCSACHDSFSGAANFKCLTCHAADVQRPGQHPNYAEAKDWLEDCASCHVDHRGTHAMTLLPRETREGKPQVSCGQCHDADMVVTKRINEVSLPQATVLL
ncbi:MAG: FHA domain-containing protein, partial [Planctomycetes bacterium]|nr:FHA domain-containing protein [Planctomycetota bacterium]